MPASTMTYVLSHIRNNIPRELLELAFKSQQHSSTIEQRIKEEVVDGIILLDINLVGGKRRDIMINLNWKIRMNVTDEFSAVGQGVENSLYLIPPEARENRNIASVIGLTPTLTSSFPGSGLNQSGRGNFGNTATAMLSEMINSRTMDQYSIAPQITLEGTNIIRFYPELQVDGIAVSVMLEYDAEFLNMNQSGLFALRNLGLCAVQRYIYNNLRIPVDETQVVAGMEIGVIKDLIVEYGELAKNYQELLMKLKGAMSFDPRSLSRLIYHAL